MKRRQFVLSLGAVGAVTAGVTSVGGFGPRGARATGHVEVRFWLSERAATYDAVDARVAGYLRRAFERAGVNVRVVHVGTVSVSTENGYRLMRSLEWPRRVVAMSAGGGGASLDGVNLLVTDGDMSTAPTGMGTAHVAAVGGASLLAQLDPVEETPLVTDYDEPERVAQVVIHECGHALGLDHNHGSILDRGDHVVVSPMVSTYPWAPERVRRAEFDHDSTACGTAYPDVAGKDIRLQLEFAECAARTLARRTG